MKKTYKTFVRCFQKGDYLREDTLSFSYDDGGTEQFVVITGSSGQIKRVKNSLPDGTKFTTRVPKDAMEVSASEWLKLF